MDDDLTGFETVLPCPFCGSTELELVADSRFAVYVYCFTCDAAGGNATHKAGAVENWNRRATPPAGPDPASTEPPEPSTT